MVSLVVMVVVGTSETETAALVRREEGLAPDKLAPDTNQDGTNNHTDDRDAHTSDNTDQDGQNDVRGELAKQLGPSVLALLCHVSRVVTMVLVTLWARVAVGALDTHHASTAVHLHLGQLSGNDRAPLADDGRALFLFIFHGRSGVLRCSLFNLANQELVFGKLDKVNANVRKAVDENRTDFDNLQVDNDHIHSLVGDLCCRLDLEAESKLLLNSLGSTIVGSEFVMTLEVCGIVVILVMLLVMLGLVDDLRGDENVGEWIRVGIEFEAVYQ